MSTPADQMPVNTGNATGKESEMEYMDNIKTELQKCFWEEYREYIKSTPMTPYERRLLRKWVSDCHSVYHDPGSKYLGYSAIPMPFLDVYRMDREFDLEMKGMNKIERIEYLKKATGWTDPPQAESDEWQLPDE